MTGIWEFDDRFDVDTSLVGYAVHATDGRVGNVDETSYEAGGSYVVVDTGPERDERKVLLPAGVVTAVDHMMGSVSLSCGRDDIEGAPVFDPLHDRDDAYRELFGAYYDDLPEEPDGA